MGRVVLGVVGAAVGGVYGYYTGDYSQVQTGFAVGYSIGAATEPKPNTEGPRLSDLRFTSSAYGQPIPWIRGSPRVSGQVVWASEKREVANTSGGGKGGGDETTTYSYEVDVLVMLCDHMADSVTRIWSNGKLVWTRRYGASDESLAASDGSNLWRRLTFYAGSAAQLPDPTYEAAVGAGNAPAYRGRTTLMFEGLQLGTSGQLPNLTFEVAESADSRFGSITAGPTRTVAIGVGTPAAAGTTKFRVHMPQWDNSYSTAAVSVVDFDILAGTSTAIGGYTAVNQYADAAQGTTDVSCMLSSASTGGTLYTGTSGTRVTLDYTENIGGAQVRFALSASALVVGSSSVGSTRLRRYDATTGGSATATSAALGYYVSSMIIIGSSLYIVATSGTDIKRLDLATLTVQETIAMPGYPGYVWPLFFNDGSGLGFISTRTSGGSTLGIYTRQTDGSWVDSGSLPSPYAMDSQYTNDTVGVVGGLLVGGRILSSPTRYATWTAPLTTAAGTSTLRSVVDALCERAGMPSGTYDTAALAGITRPVRSVAVTNGPTRGTLEQLAVAYFFGASLRDKLYFRARGGTAAATIPWSDLAASGGNDGADDQSLPLTIGNELELPPQVAVTYINVSDDAQAGTEYSDRMSDGQAAVRAVSVGLGMTPADAKGVADALLADSSAALVSGAIALPITYARLDPSDVVDVVDTDGRTYRLRLERKRDEAGVLSFDVVGDDSASLTSSEITDGTQTNVNTVTRPGDTVFQALDIPLLRDADDGPGYYVSAKGSTANWPGGQVLSSNNNVDFATAAEVNESAVFGTCTTTLGDFTGIGMDERNVLRVSVGAGTLSSATRDALLADAAVNALLVGDEVIRFQRATLISAGVYDLSGLLRGQRGTEWAMAGHAASERCTLLRPQGLRRVAQQISEGAQLRYLRGATLGSAASLTSVQFTNSNRGLKPFAPVNLRVLQPVGGGYMVTWLRRTRYATKFVGTAGAVVPLGETSEAYVVELLSPADALLSTQAVSAPQVTLSVARVNGTLPSPTIKTALISGAYVGVEYAGNTNSSLRQLVKQTASGVLARSPYLGAGLVDAVYTATDAYTAAYYLTAGVPSYYADGFVQRFSLADITTAAATYTAATAGDVGGIAHDGTDLWVIERISKRLRKLNASSLAVISTPATFTGPVANGLASASGKLFFIDQGQLVCWDTAGASETWRVSVPSWTAYTNCSGIVTHSGNVFVSTYPAGLIVFAQSDGSVVANTGIVDASLAQAGGVTRFGSGFVAAFRAEVGGSRQVVVLNSSTGAVASSFDADYVGGSDGTSVIVLGSDSPGAVGYTVGRLYEPLAGSLAGYQVRVFQVSASAGRGYSATVTI